MTQPCVLLVKYVGTNSQPKEGYNYIIRHILESTNLLALAVTEGLPQKFYLTSIPSFIQAKNRFRAINVTKSFQTGEHSGRTGKFMSWVPSLLFVMYVPDLTIIVRIWQHINESIPVRGLISVGFVLKSLPLSVT